MDEKRRWSALAMPRAGEKTMSVFWVTLVPTETSTRALVMLGQDEILRAILPPFSEVKNEDAVRRFLDALSLWLDGRVCVALCVAESETHSFRLGLVDELHQGMSSIFFSVLPLPPEARRRGRRLRALGDFARERQLWLSAATSEP
jgi:hypothetical protein